jgi:aminopeptidase N
MDEAVLPVDGVLLRALGPEGTDLAGALAITAPMLRFFHAQLGVRYPASEYVQAVVPGNVAQEAAGLSLLGVASIEDVRQDPSEDWIFAHELAHQWFAWLVPCADFSDFWLNEGFATFLVAAYKEQRWGRAAYEREVTLWRARSAKVHAAGKDAPVALPAPVGLPRTPPKEQDLPPRGVTYARGALVLHRLRESLGDAVFWRGVQGYVRERSDKPTRTEHLRSAFEAASGQDLRSFFSTWVYTSAPDL